MKAGRAVAVLLCSIAAVTAPASFARAQETVITASCVLAISAAIHMLEGEYVRHQPTLADAGFSDIFRRNYGSISCYEDAEGFVIYFRPPNYKPGSFGGGLYMVRMGLDHQVEYATSMR